MGLVPVEDALLVEAKLMPEDMGRVTNGLSVNAKGSSFEHQRFGRVPGQVQKVSANTYIEKDNTRYCLAEIKLAKNLCRRSYQLQQYRARHGGSGG